MTADADKKHEPSELPFGPAPDLQELVARFGGYDKITPQAWAAHDQAMADWQAARRAYYRDLQLQRKGQP